LTATGLTLFQAEEGPAEEEVLENQLLLDAASGSWWVVMSKRRGATAWLCWMPAFLSGQDVRKLPWSKCFPSMSLPRTGRQTTS